MTGPKTVTAKQLAANRRNARRSTGPHSREGKSRSRWNAMKHGVLSNAIIPQPLLPHESREDFDLLLATLRREFAPQSAIEEILVETIAACYWRLGRIVRAEAAAISERLISTQDDLAQAHTEANQEASYRAGFGHADTLRQQVVSLSKAMGDTRRLRSLMSRYDSHWRDAPQEQLLDAAKIRLVDLQRQLADQESQELIAHQHMRSIPEIELALNLSSYETRFFRQLSRALNELEHIQRRRAGDTVLPPVNITVTHEAT